MWGRLGGVTMRRTCNLDVLHNRITARQTQSSLLTNTTQPQRGVQQQPGGNAPGILQRHKSAAHWCL
jgi:hypothetical protein